MPRIENTERYKKYKALADATTSVYFVGRLATYKYYNMDQVVAQALTLFNKIAAASRAEDNAEGQENIDEPSVSLTSAS